MKRVNLKVAQLESSWMSYSVSTIQLFNKQVKRLAKKYPSLKKDLRLLIERLEIEPDIGTSLGNNFYKIRIAIKSKGKGKSGGARVVTYVKMVRKTVYLTTIIDKSERSTISEKELDQIFTLIP